MKIEILHFDKFKFNHEEQLHDIYIKRISQFRNIITDIKTVRINNKGIENRIVKNAIAYATDRDDKKQKEFQNILRGIGFDVKLKPYIQRSDGTAKADWDVGITIDVMEYAKNSDIIVLASGAGDFDMLLSYVKQRHDTKFELYSVENLTSISLIREASRYFPITDDLLLK